MAAVRNSVYYDANPRRVWALVTDLGALAKVCAGYVSFEGLPEGRIFTGQKIEPMVRLFGRLPARRYHMFIELCDDAAMRFQTREQGAGTRRWDHALWLTAEARGTRLDEEIDIDAGLATPLVAWWAGKLLRGRHQPRIDLLNSGAF